MIGKYRYIDIKINIQVLLIYYKKIDSMVLYSIKYTINYIQVHRS